MIIGILVVGASVFLAESAGRYLLDKTQISGELKNTLVGITDSAIALLSYVSLFRFYEKRRIKEFSLVTLWKNALAGFGSGLILQSLGILAIYLAGGYFILHANPISFLLPAFITALTAGFVAEILI